MSTTHVYHNSLINVHTVEGPFPLSLKWPSAFSTAKEFKTQIQCHFLHKTLPHIPSLKLLLTVDLGIIAPALTLYTAFCNSHAYMYILSSGDGQLFEVRDHASFTPSPVFPLSSPYQSVSLSRSIISILLIGWRSKLTEISYEKFISGCQNFLLCTLQYNHFLRQISSNSIKYIICTDPSIKKEFSYFILCAQHHTWNHERGKSNQNRSNLIT